MKAYIDSEYMIEQLKMLLNTPSPSGYCGLIMSKLQEEVRRLGYTMTITNKGNGLISIPGADGSRTTALSAHVDTLGAMVRSIKEKGTLRMTYVGGYMMGSIENEYCVVHTRDGRTYDGTILTTKPSVHVFPDARELKREDAHMEVRLDELVGSKNDVEALGIRVGDFISFDPRLQVKQNGFIKSRHLDDKASVAAILGLLKLLCDQQLVPAVNVVILISTYEEVGHGAASLPEGIDELIAVDMGAMGDDLTATERQVSICAKDSSGPYDYRMTSKLIALAESQEIDYAVDIYPQYGSDASAALKGGADIRAALIGPAVHASHSMERTHVDAIVGTTALLTAYLLDPAER
ncbi:M42 family metallopeptidase [Paenibacillus chartarius]|uniref:M42 family metallopeptidase n=1 Tax=Paenibacillus chartarius TaxID=747481 RepID=A0ABV6DPV3_9BACL